MRALLPEPAESVDVHAVYAADWVEPGGIRVNFIASVDGAASADGFSRGLQTPGDNRVFAALRDLADVVLVGSGTARAEGYGPVRPSGERLAARRRFGLPDALPIAVVSGSLDLDLDAELFATSGAGTLVVTTGSSPADRRRAVARHAEVLVCGAGRVEQVRLRRELADRGLRRVLCEGGPGLFETLAAQGGVDELCLTISPLLVGAGPDRITTGAPFGHHPAQLTVRSLLEEDGALFARYRLQPAQVRDSPGMTSSSE